MEKTFYIACKSINATQKKITGHRRKIISCQPDSFSVGFSFNHSIHSTLYKIILSTQHYPFSTFQLSPCFLWGSNLRKQKNLRAGRMPSSLGNALFKAIYTIYFCAFDSNTTDSTCVVHRIGIQIINLVA